MIMGINILLEKESGDGGIAVHQEDARHNMISKTTNSE